MKLVEIGLRAFWAARATCAQHSIFDQAIHEGIACTKARKASHHISAPNHHRDISACACSDLRMHTGTGIWTFPLHGCFNTRTFRHRDILAQGIFSTMEILPQTISAQTFWHLCYCAKISMCQNIYRAKTCIRRNVSGRNVTCRNVGVMVRSPRK